MAANWSQQVRDAYKQMQERTYLAGLRALREDGNRPISQLVPHIPHTFQPLTQVWTHDMQDAVRFSPLFRGQEADLQTDASVSQLGDRPSNEYFEEGSGDDAGWTSIETTPSTSGLEDAMLNDGWDEAMLSAVLNDEREENIQASEDRPASSIPPVIQLRENSATMHRAGASTHTDHPSVLHIGGGLRREKGSTTAAPTPSTSYSDPSDRLNQKRKLQLEGSQNSKRLKVSANDSQTLECETIESAFKRRIFSGKIVNSLEILDPRGFMEACKGIVIKEMKSTIGNHRSGFKMNCSIELSYLIHKPEEEKIISTFFNSMTKLVLSTSNLDDIFHAMLEDISANISKFEGQASSKSLFSVHALVISMALYDPLHASSFIALPQKIRSKQAIVNIRNRDNYCFAWSMLASKYPANQHTDRVSSYPKDLLFKVFNYDGIEFPFSLHQIEDFEKQNAGVSVAVFGIEGDDNIIPLYQPAETKENHVNLLYIENGDKAHFCWIKNISRLITGQVTRHNGFTWLCEACMKRCANEEKLNAHKLKCNKCQILKMPQEGDVLEFKSFSKGAPVPFVIYADIESVLTPVHSCEPSHNTSWTRSIQEHEAMSIALKLVCRHDEALSKFFLFRGPNAISDFVRQLRIIADDVIDVYSKIAPMQLTPEEEQNFRDASECHICLKEFALNDTKTRDHDHVTGAFLGASHNACNLNRKVPDFIPIFFHALSNYDSHFLIKHLSYDDKPISCIAQSSERYIAFSKRYRNIQFRFLDSFKFLDDKLSSLADMLEEEDFKLTRAEYPDEERFKLATSKGIFPYDYVTSLEKLKETQLPSKEEFKSKLQDIDISEEDYRHAIKVWNVFKIRTLGEYSDLYLKTDTLLLSDIFEKFRDLLLAMYKLDPAWYYTLPGIAFDAMLKTTKAKLSLISDKSMLEFFESGIRGGLCTVVKRYSKANHMYMEDYTQSVPVNFLSYIDLNNLYGKSMVSSMPYAELKWLSKEEINLIDFASIPENSEYGYVLEVDFEYPQAIHDAHNELPFCAESAVPPTGGFKKLLATLDNKFKYVLHYRVLQQCIEQGLILKCIHRVVSYKQSQWLKTYIDLNTQKRAQEKSKFGQSLWKKMNNAVYGKFIENVRNYSDFKIVSKWEQARKLIARSTFMRNVVFDENLVGIELAREEVFMNKPIYIGHAILDISKFIMYDFFYNVMKPNLANLKLNYMDTDSFIFETSSDIYRFIRENPQYFDTSNFEKDNAFSIKQDNKKVIGLFKDELGGKIMTEYIGLRAKLYAYRYQGQTVKKSKGITRGGMRSIDFSHYFDCLQDLNLKYYTLQKTFRSSKHKITTIESNKIALHGKDDKRKLIEGTHDTLAWGHYSLSGDC